MAMLLLLSVKGGKAELVTAPNSQGNSITHPVMEGEMSAVREKKPRNAPALQRGGECAVRGGACPGAEVRIIQGQGRQSELSLLWFATGLGQLWVELACFNPCERQPT